MFTSENVLSPARREWLEKIRREKLRIRCAKIGILVLFMALWELAAQLGFIDPFITSCPSRFTRSIFRLFSQGDLMQHILVTTGEAVAGFILGTLAGTLIAVLLWYFDFARKVAEPYLVILNALPKIALGPIFIVWIGAGAKAIIVIAITVSIIVTVMEVLHGFILTDPDMIKLVMTFGAKKLDILTKVVLPANIPTIVSSLKVNVGMSWVGVIVGEFLISKAGLGYLIVYGSQVFQLDLVMASVVILSFIAALMFFCIEWFERLLKSKRKGSL